MKQLIFVVETNSSNKSDDRYISRLIKERYDLSSKDIKIQFVHMAGKSKYADKSVTTKIKKFVSENNNGSNFVIYCFDTDRIDCESCDKEKYNDEKNYCIKNKYKLIWFYYDIEYVLIGRSVESNQKYNESKRFNTSRSFNVNVSKLMSSGPEKKGYSNVYYILDKLLPKKS